MLRTPVLAFLAAFLITQTARGGDPPAFDRKTDVVYGRKDGMALTMDVFTPPASQRRGHRMDRQRRLVLLHDAVAPGFIDEFLKRGYTVFAVVHGSQPRFTIPEIVKDLNRAVRFIRYHAKDYHIDPDRIGVTGGSAGGHLSLMQGTAGDLGDKDAKDPVDQVSSRVQVVGCFFPPPTSSTTASPAKMRWAAESWKGSRPRSTSRTSRPQNSCLPADHRRGENPRNRPPDQSGESRVLR